MVIRQGRWVRVYLVYTAALVALLVVLLHGKSNETVGVQPTVAQVHPHGEATVDSLQGISTEVGESRAPIQDRQAGTRIEPTLLGNRYFRILDAATEHPVASGTARLDGGIVGDSVISPDSQGYLIIPDVSASTPRLWRLSGLRYADVYVLDTAGGVSRSSATEVMLPRGAFLVVTILTAQGSPAPNLPVQITCHIRDSLVTPAASVDFEQAYNGGDHSYTTVVSGVTGERSHATKAWVGTTDSAGRCVFESLPPNVPLTPTIVDVGGVLVHQQSLTLEPSETRTAVWQLPTSTSLEVVVSDQQGRPVVNAAIVMVDASSTGSLCPGRPESIALRSGMRFVQQSVTDADGVAHYDDIRPGDYYIGPGLLNVDGGCVYDPSEVAHIGTLCHIGSGEGKSTLTLMITVDRGLYIGGVAVEEDGRPCKHLHLRLTSPILCAQYMAETDANGSFLIGPVANVQFSLTPILKDGYSLPSINATPGDVAIAVNVPRLGALEVRVIDGQSGADLSIQSATISIANSVSRMDGGDGKVLSLKSLPAGLYGVVIQTQGSKIAVAEVEVSAGEGANSRVILKAEPAAVLDVANRCPQWGEIRAFQGSTMVAYAVCDSGKSTQVQVPVGDTLLVLKPTTGESIEKRVRALPATVVSVSIP